jgi:hypothetical protein
MNDSPAAGAVTGVADGAGNHGSMAIISDAVSIDLPLQTRADVRLQPETLDAAAHTEDRAPKRDLEILPADRTRKVCRPDVREADLNSVPVLQG